MTQSKHDALLDQFLLRVQEKRFYDAHESLELIWFPRRFDNDDEIKLLKGFINAAVSFELIKRGRRDASKRVWKNYLKYKTLLISIESPHIDKYYYISCYLDKYNAKLCN